jgi:hypothetical protein
MLLFNHNEHISTTNRQKHHFTFDFWRHFPFQSLCPLGSTYHLSRYETALVNSQQCRVYVVVGVSG